MAAEHAAGKLSRWSGTAAVVLAYAILLGYVAFSATRVTHGFVAYYTASSLLVSGQLGPSIYDDEWFQRQVRELTGSGVIEIFGPNPPTMALMAVPITSLDHALARTLWLLGSLSAFVLALVLLARAQQPRVVTPLVCAVLMVTPPVFANLRTGQAYLFMCALFAATCLSLQRGRGSLAGVFLGLALASKSSGVALLVILAAQRRWRTLIAAAAVACGAAVATLFVIDPRTWETYPAYVQTFVARASSSVTAYQTTLGLARHLCVADPTWNPSPVAECARAAFLLPPVILGGAVVLTIWWSRKATMRLWLAAAVCLSELTLPVAAEPHFVLLTIPVVLLWPFNELGRWRMAFVLLVAVLLFVPLDLTAHTFTGGWSAVAAYPRLYAAWLLWAAAAHAMYRCAPPTSPFVT